MPGQRTISLPGTWAENANTNIPAPPIPGIAYRNSQILLEDWLEGQKYSSVADSAVWNQLNWLLTNMLREIERYGILPWSALTTYSVSAITLGMDGLLYQSKLATGPETEHGPQMPVATEDPDDNLFWAVFGGGGGGGNIPIGGIIMWSGAILDIPAGWALCDGSGGTPNLRDKFIVGAGLNYATGSSGGSVNHTHIVINTDTTAAGTNANTTATGTNAALTLATTQIPSHTHTSLVTDSLNGVYTGPGATKGGNTGATGGGGSHTHTFTGTAHTHTFTGTAHTHTASADNAINLPPYYALAFIMRIA